METRTVEFLESIHGHPWRSCDELEQSGPHLVREGKDNSPEPLDDYVVGMIVSLKSKLSAEI